MTWRQLTEPVSVGDPWISWVESESAVIPVHESDLVSRPFSPLIHSSSPHRMSRKYQINSTSPVFERPRRRWSILQSSIASGRAENRAEVLHHENHAGQQGTCQPSRSCLASPTPQPHCAYDERRSEHDHRHAAVKYADIRLGPLGQGAENQTSLIRGGTLCLKHAFPATGGGSPVHGDAAVLYALQ